MQLQEAEPIKVTNKQQLESDAEAFLARLYGKVPHEGLRRTLKKSPYPRFSSPASPLGRRPRPRLVESVRGQEETTFSCRRRLLNCPFSFPSLLRTLRCEAKVLQDSDQLCSAPTSGSSHCTSATTLSSQPVTLLIAGPCWLSEPRGRRSRRHGRSSGSVTVPLQTLLIFRCYTLKM